MALLLCLVGMTAALAHGCLHCQSNFSEKFSFYRHHVNLKSWWVGDIPVSGALLTDWSDNTMKELHLTIPAEITWEKLDQVARAVYQRMDQLYQGKMYFPGYFPNELRNIFREQVQLLQNAIIESRIDCQRHCGIFQYETISCSNCTDSHVICFGYNCESSEQWKSAVQGLLNYINNWHKDAQSHPSLPGIASLQVSGVPTPGQSDLGKCRRVFQAALTALGLPPHNVGTGTQPPPVLLELGGCCPRSPSTLDSARAGPGREGRDAGGLHWASAPGQVHGALECGD
ncbi:izumo sperm-egg fusion protein 4 isoform X6 [Sapajus apella]|uniref:Izumo sperm-egg fusion protein 4 isoform X6 n=1 Tax=Sapajus apella TaxID=9515 RepID=A0A6J3FRP0_SAPAP|nr:izumo sperm-egg fusion protein 4 isoform X6 [Sapajus apella]